MRTHTHSSPPDIYKESTFPRLKLLQKNFEKLVLSCVSTLRFIKWMLRSRRSLIHLSEVDTEVAFYLYVTGLKSVGIRGCCDPSMHSLIR